MRLLLLGSSSNPATIAAMLGKVSAAVTARELDTGTAQASLAKVTAAVSASVKYPATVAATLGGITAAVSAELVNPAIVAATLGKVTASATYSTFYMPPSPTGWKSSATRVGPDPAFATSTRRRGEA